MGKSKNTVSAFDKQANTFAQVTNHSLALFFDDVPLECHLFAQEFLDGVIHPPPRSKNVSLTLHSQCQTIQQPTELTCFKDDPVLRISRPSFAFARLPCFQHHFHDFGV